ncbi:DUF2188 domain-containing protein [Streptomyces sp. YIM 98790]|uniref:DUF2188 domain-containing protein n=1 Tax=Streptomyces sp. YIM 98790 TaxID=2689077 RepID=UPI0014096CEB|nr:DUF2188 domain-containing protein [Streptomyces sp. YIM 98790]
MARSKQSRTRYHVLPDHDAASDERWKVRQEGGREGEACRTQRQAISAARARAREHERSQVIVHGRDGRVRTEYTHGSDPRRTPG